jgi:DNA-binding PadR family transcriptional regulator
MAPRLLVMGPAPGQPGFRRGGPMTGGQIYAAAERSVARFWNLTRSQVYAELPRLAEAGLIAEAGEIGPRGARPYRATPAGRRAFQSWMRDFVGDGAQDDQLRSPLLLTVFFGHFIPARRLRALLEDYRRRHEESLSIATAMLEALGPDDSLPGAALERRASYERMMSAWLADTVRRVDRT